MMDKSVQVSNESNQHKRELTDTSKLGMFIIPLGGGVYRKEHYEQEPNPTRSCVREKNEPQQGLCDCRFQRN